MLSHGVSRLRGRPRRRNCDGRQQSCRRNWLPFGSLSNRKPALWILSARTWARYRRSVRFACWKATWLTSQPAPAQAIAAHREAYLMVQKLRVTLKVTEMVSHRCRSGHTAVSWAAAVGEADILGLLLSRGGPPAHQDLLLHAAARAIQVAYRQHKFYERYVTCCIPLPVAWVADSQWLGQAGKVEDRAVTRIPHPRHRQHVLLALDHRVHESQA